jgi:hypothetical protein
MTDDMMNLRALVEKSPDADLLRDMIGFAAHRLMELEVEGLTGAAYGEKSQERQVQRNGYRDRNWETAPARSSCAFPSCARAPTSRASSSRGGWPRRHSPRWYRRLTFKASPPAPAMRSGDARPSLVAAHLSLI